MKDIINLFIIERASGLCIFEAHFKNQTKNTIDTDLLSGFLVALFELSNEMNAEGIEHVQLGNVRIVYEINKNLMYVATVERTADSKEVMDAIECVEKRFRKKYTSELKQFNGNVQVFETFTEDLEEMGIEVEEGAEMRFKVFTKSLKKIREVGGVGKELARKIRHQLGKPLDRIKEAPKKILGSIFKRFKGDSAEEQTPEEPKPPEEK